MKIITACLAFFIAFSLTAQDTTETPPPLISGDRPGYGVSTLNMPAGLFQVEAGYQGEITSYQGTGRNDWTHLAPTTLRYGITDWLELKSDIAYHKDVFQSFSNPEPENQGLLPIAIGARLGILQDQEILPNAMLYGTVGIPLQSNQVSSADLRLLVSKQITPTISLDGNIGMIVTQPNNIFQYSISGTAAVSEQASFFAEYFGKIEGQLNEGFIDGGIIFYPTNNFQIDISAGRRVIVSANNRPFAVSQNNTFFSVGAAMRIPK